MDFIYINSNIIFRMIQKIPKNIPNSISNDGFRMIPMNFFKQINNLLIYRRNDLNSEKIISEENHHNDHYKYKYYEEYFNIIQNDIYNLFNEKLFWSLNMDSRVCEHRYRNGKMKGLICGRRIDIKINENCKEDNGRWRCAKHISTKVYKPTPKNIDSSLLCIGKTGYKNKFDCKNGKKYGCYCIYHYMKKNGINDIELAKSYYKEICLFNNIEVENTNNSIIKSYKYNCIINNNLNIIDKYERNGFKNIKLICFFNDKSYFGKLSDNFVQNTKEDIVKKLKNLENSKNFRKNIIFNDFCKNNKKDIQVVNTICNLNKELINEILKINPICDNINILIVKRLYCKDHTTNITIGIIYKRCIYYFSTINSYKMCNDPYWCRRRYNLILNYYNCYKSISKIY